MTRFAPVCFCKDGFQTALLNRNPIDLTASVANASGAVQTTLSKLPRPDRNLRESARLNSCSSMLQALNESAPLGGYSLRYFLGHLGLDDVPDQAPRSFHKREFVCQATFKQDANAIVASYIGCRN